MSVFYFYVVLQEYSFWTFILSTQGKIKKAELIYIYATMLYSELSESQTIVKVCAHPCDCHLSN